MHDDTNTHPSFVVHWCLLVHCGLTMGPSLGFNGLPFCVATRSRASKHRNLIIFVCRGRDFDSQARPFHNFNKNSLKSHLQIQKAPPSEHDPSRCCWCWWSSFLFLFFFCVFEKWRFWCCWVVPNEPDSPPLPPPPPFSGFLQRENGDLAVLWFLNGWFLLVLQRCYSDDWLTHTHIHTEENRYYPSEENQELAK